MALNIKDAETDRIARRLAALTGERLTDAVRAALSERLAREMRRPGKTVDWARLREAQEQIARLSVADARADDELLDYDEAGLPR